MTEELFNVAQFFADGYWEYVRRGVPVKDACDAFAHYTTSVGARAGLVARVIITDGGDSICAEWQKGQGLTFPPTEAKRNENRNLG